MQCRHGRLPVIFAEDLQRANNSLTSPRVLTYLEGILPAEHWVLSNSCHITLESLHALRHEIPATASCPLRWRQRRRQNSRKSLEAPMKPPEVAKPDRELRSHKSVVVLKPTRECRGMLERSRMSRLTRRAPNMQPIAFSFTYVLSTPPKRPC